ncbi:hypothetical protein AB205_0065340 [Aquarana catesbeiana]|uniref:UPAR/Ly6 domain-containing protein n=1 Tax=Aquarana catesbeiana TaxID=8400 RepID=A0A2G9RKC4_AQUCT|nr:hypothetical protein AB205_0065340 [Aquarana catesbeiana]
MYSEISCCGYNNCNQGVNTVKVNETLNGLQCYACNETGKGECTTPFTTSCTGNMTSCVDAQGNVPSHLMLFYEFEGEMLMSISNFGCCSSWL